jgi:hypothetical protein
MALSKSITLKSNFGDDVVFNNAYIRVVNITGNKQQLNVEAHYCKTKDGMFLHKTQSAFTPSLDANNFIAQAYEHLKTLQEFTGATDC